MTTEWDDADALRASVLRRMRASGWGGDASAIERGEYTPAKVAEAFEGLTRAATDETRRIAADLRRLAELEGEEAAA